MSSVNDHQAGVASGINNSVARIAGALAIAILTAIAVPHFAAVLDAGLEADGAPAALRAALAAKAGHLAEIEVPEHATVPSAKVFRQ
jgi:hypothetical protein